MVWFADAGPGGHGHGPTWGHSHCQCQSVTMTVGGKRLLARLPGRAGARAGGCQPGGSESSVGKVCNYPRLTKGLAATDSSTQSAARRDRVTGRGCARAHANAVGLVNTAAAVPTPADASAMPVNPTRPTQTSPKRQLDPSRSGGAGIVR